VLTAFAIRRLMENDGITLLDFGRGDDTYKRGWATNRTPHIGVLSVDIARRPMLVARHLLGGLIRGRRAPDSGLSPGVAGGLVKCAPRFSATIA